MWSDSRIMEFWQQNEAEFSGDVKSGQVVRLSRRYIKGKVLDVGAGSGALLDLLPDAIGIDIVPRHSRVVKGDVSDMPFADALFDTVFATDILEHLTEEKFVSGLSEIKRVMKIGARLIIVVPYREHLNEGMVSCPNCHTKFHRWGHLKVFDESNIMSSLRTCGFKVVEMRFMPLSLMAEHRIIRWFWRWFIRVGFLQVSDLFVVAERC